jgi:hypothetical protein
MAPWTNKSNKLTVFASYTHSHLSCFSYSPPYLMAAVWGLLLFVDRFLPLWWAEVSWEPQLVKTWSGMLKSQSGSCVRGPAKEKGMFYRKLAEGHLEWGSLYLDPDISLQVSPCKAWELCPADSKSTVLSLLPLQLTQACPCTWSCHSKMVIHFTELRGGFGNR